MERQCDLTEFKDLAQDFIELQEKYNDSIKLLKRVIDDDGALYYLGSDLFNDIKKEVN